MIDVSKLKNRTARLIGEEKCKQSAILVPIVSYQNEDCLLFEVRSQNLKSQPGEICFPGGRVEQRDKNEEETAVRETCEELGLSKSDIKVVGPLDILVTPFQFKITPFVAQLDDYRKIKLNQSEVESVFYVPAKYFLNNPPQTYFNKITIQPHSDFPLHLLPNGKTYNWGKGSYPVHFYQYQEYVIWGITARIIQNFVQILKV